MVVIACGAPSLIDVSGGDLQRKLLRIRFSQFQTMFSRPLLALLGRNALYSTAVNIETCWKRLVIIDSSRFVYSRIFIWFFYCSLSSHGVADDARKLKSSLHSALKHNSHTQLLDLRRKPKITNSSKSLRSGWWKWYFECDETRALFNCSHTITKKKLYLR